MKFSLIVAALAVYAQARFRPKQVPEAMRGQHRDRWSVVEVDGKQIKQGTHALDYQAEMEDGVTAYCLKEARGFDSYCHQYKTK